MRTKLSPYYVNTGNFCRNATQTDLHAHPCAPPLNMRTTHSIEVLQLEPLWAQRPVRRVDPSEASEADGSLSARHGAAASPALKLA